MQLSTIYTQRLEEAIQKGIERGRELTQREIATNLLSTGMEIEQVARVTGLSPEEVRELLTNKEH